MAINFNGIEVTDINFNGTALDKVIYNNTTVWESWKLKTGSLWRPWATSQCVTKQADPTKK